MTGATDDIALTAASFTGINPSSPLDTYSTTGGSSGNPANTLTTTTSNDLIVTALHRHTTTAATTNRTPLSNLTATSTLSAASYQVATTTGAYTDTYTGSASANWSMISAGFKPATAESTATSTQYIHADHLSSTNAVTDQSGNTLQVLDYYPYGTARIDQTYTTFDAPREYIGQEYDEETALSYLNARYYRPTTGGFLSEDPVFWKLSANLFLDPQLQNSYGYARNNPIIYKDPNGEIPILVITAGVGALIGGVSGVATQAIGDYVSGNDFKFSNYAGAFTGGAAQGALAGSGVGLLVSGGAGGLAQGVTREGIDAYNGEGFEYGGVAEDTISNAVLGVVGGKIADKLGVPAVAEVTTGRNSMSAVAKSTATKMANGTIGSYSLSTAGKIGVSYMVGDTYGTAVDRD